ncbi:MAG: hypothetical protein K0S70_5224, partial [Microbacterium sp.]|nr:hypothetical protein [Microbacterium sp.]
MITTHDQEMTIVSPRWDMAA